MKDEFDAMVTMYEILDDNAVKPISYTDIEPWKENQREAYNLPENSMKGEYWMEKINGLSLQHIMNILQRKIGKLQPGETSKNPERQVRDKEKLVNIRTQIQTVKDKLGKTDFEHGDVFADNILIEKGTNKVKLMDPSGVRKGDRYSNDSDGRRFTKLLKMLDEILDLNW